MNDGKDCSDAHQLSEADGETLVLLKEYSEDAFARAQSRFNSLDSKAFQTVGLVAVIGGILVFRSSSSDAMRILEKVLLGVSAAGFALATVFCLLSLRVRTLKDPPTAARVINWFTQQPGDDIRPRMISALIVDLANAERDYLAICVSKARYLAVGQVFDVLGILALLVFVVVSRLS